MKRKYIGRISGLWHDGYTAGRARMPRVVPSLVTAEHDVRWWFAGYDHGRTQAPRFPQLVLPLRSESQDV